MNANRKHSKDCMLGLGWRLLLIGTVLLSGRGGSAQLLTKPFSADQVKTTQGKTETAKVYATQSAMRAEGVQDGRNYISIMRFDRKVLWSLMPDDKIYFEMPIPAGAQAAVGMKELMKGVEVKRESLGSEKVGGFTCDKTRMTVT